MSDYKPINCGLHSELELLAMRRKLVRLEVMLENDQKQEISGRVLDVYTREGAEYLQMMGKQGQTIKLRLDRIIAITQA